MFGSLIISAAFVNILSLSSMTPLVIPLATPLWHPLLPHLSIALLKHPPGFVSSSFSSSPSLCVLPAYLPGLPARQEGGFYLGLVSSRGDVLLQLAHQRFVLWHPADDGRVKDPSIACGSCVFLMPLPGCRVEISSYIQEL